MEYEPLVSGGRTVGRYNLGGFRALLLTDVQSDGKITYEHVLFVMRSSALAPVLAVTSEVAAVGGHGSHVLGLFPGNGHVNLGTRDEWANLSAFESKALDVAAQHLGLDGAWAVDA